MMVDKQRLALSLGLIFTTACTGTMGTEVGATSERLELEIATPVDGAILGSPLVAVTGTANTETVRVQGLEVPVADGHFATTVTLPGDGDAVIEVGIFDATQEIHVLVDSTPPEIVIEQPTSPAFIEGNIFRVVGQVDDEGAVELTADGDAISVGSDGTFVYERPVDPGAHRVRLIATDRAGHESIVPVAAIVGEFAGRAEPVEDAAALSVDRDGFATVSGGIQHILNSDEFRNDIRWRIIGRHGDVSIEDVNYGNAELSIVPVDGGLYARAVLGNVYVRVRVRIDLLIGSISFTGHLRVEAMEVTAHLNAWAQDGRIQAGVAGANVVAHGFSYNVPGVPGFIEGFFRGTIRRLLEDQSRNAITNTLNNEVPSALSEVSLDASFDVLGTDVTVLGTFHDLVLDDAGMHARLNATTWSDDALEERTAVGWLRQEHPGLGRRMGRNVVAQVSVDAINALSFATWSGFVPYLSEPLPGLSGGELSVAQLAIVTGATFDPAIPADSPIVASIDMALPPVVTTDGDLVRIDCPDARITLSALAGETTAPLVTLSIALSAPIDVVPAPDGTLSIVIGDLDIVADAIDAPPGFTTGEDLDLLLNDIAPLLTGSLLEISGLELPTFVGFTFQDPEYTVRDRTIEMGASLAFSP